MQIKSLCCANSAQVFRVLNLKFLQNVLKGHIFFWAVFHAKLDFFKELLLNELFAT
jgi:hypothetical protein